MWKPKDNTQKSVLSFHHVGSRDRTQVTKLGQQVPIESSHLLRLMVFKIRSWKSG